MNYNKRVKENLRNDNKKQPSNLWLSTQIYRFTFNQTYKKNFSVAYYLNYVMFC